MLETCWSPIWRSNRMPTTGEACCCCGRKGRSEEGPSPDKTLGRSHRLRPDTTRPSRISSRMAGKVFPRAMGENVLDRHLTELRRPAGETESWSGSSAKLQTPARPGRCRQQVHRTFHCELSTGFSRVLPAPLPRQSLLHRAPPPAFPRPAAHRSAIRLSTVRRSAAIPGGHANRTAPARGSPR
jgi:hypothetical protein